MPAELENDAYGLFYTFNKRLKAAGATPDNEWRQIKQTYLMLEEWFEDRVLYHMVGFLVSQGMPINQIRALSLNCTKSAFEQRLRSEIFRRVVGNELPNPPDDEAVRAEVAERLSELTYGSKQQDIKSFLLLFNLATLLPEPAVESAFSIRQFQERTLGHRTYPFRGRRQTGAPPRSQKWLENCLGYLRSQHAVSELCQKIEAFLDLSQVQATHEVFDPLYEESASAFR
jgi:hypothetical protein